MKKLIILAFLLLSFHQNAFATLKKTIYETGELQALMIALEEVAVEEIPSVLQFQWREDFWHPGKLSACTETNRDEVIEEIIEWGNAYNELSGPDFEMDRVRAEAEAFFPHGKVLRCSDGRPDYYAWISITSYIFVDDYYRIQFEVAYDD